MVDPEIIPHLLKYMGSKREMLSMINGAIKEMQVDSTCLCDLFSGTAIVTAVFLDQFDVISNDIQTYSGVFAYTYASNLEKELDKDFVADVKKRSQRFVDEWHNLFPQYRFSYENINGYDDLLEIEKKQQKLINENFDLGFSLFVKMSNVYGLIQ